MLRMLTGLAISLTLIITLHAQQIEDHTILKVAVTPVEQLPDYLLQLTSSNAAIREDYILNEKLLNLVDAYQADSILPSRKQRHRVFGGSIIKILGYNWRAIDMKRQKFIGTLKNDLRVPHKDSDKFTEYDVNWDLVPHREPYIALMYRSYQTQYDIHRRWKENHTPEGLFQNYPNDSTLQQYRVHCELTPPMGYRQELNDKFYPVIQPMRLEQHHNFGESRPTVGMYDPFVSDCNHSCHTELHPYEWLWWLDVNPGKDELQNEKRWLVGFFREYSNRFKKWSKPPRTGHIKVPFIFPRNVEEWTLTIEHLVYSHLNDETLQRINMPEQAQLFYSYEIEVLWPEGSGIENRLLIENPEPLISKGIRFWIDDVQTDDQWLFGYLNIAVSIEDVYTARVTVGY